MDDRLKKFLKVEDWGSPVQYRELLEKRCDGFKQLLIEYKGSENDLIRAYLLIPDSQGTHPAILVHHQHNGEWHLGKSEVVGLAGDPLQAFGPALVRRGFVVLAPDSICFEDRRRNKSGTEPDRDEKDWLQHFNEMTYRLVKGDTLMHKILEGANIALSLLYHSPVVRKDRMGIVGHSYGGNTALFQAAINDRILFTCSSGAACSYQNKMNNQTSLEMALAIPGFLEQFEMEDVVKAIAPRLLLIISAEDDKYSRDADRIAPISDSLTHRRYSGGHALTRERFDYIVDWIARQ